MLQSLLIHLLNKDTADDISHLSKYQVTKQENSFVFRTEMYVTKSS